MHMYVCTFIYVHVRIEHVELRVVACVQHACERLLWQHAHRLYEHSHTNGHDGD